MSCSQDLSFVSQNQLNSYDIIEHNITSVDLHYAVQKNQNSIKKKI